MPPGWRQSARGCTRATRRSGSKIRYHRCGENGSFTRKLAHSARRRVLKCCVGQKAGFKGATNSPNRNFEGTPAPPANLKLATAVTPPGQLAAAHSTRQPLRCATSSAASSCDAGCLSSLVQVVDVVRRMLLTSCWLLNTVQPRASCSRKAVWEMDASSAGTMVARRHGPTLPASTGGVNP